VCSSDLGVALRGAPEAMAQRVMALLPPEAQAALRDYLEQPQSKEKIMEARSKVLSEAYALAAKGQLSIKKTNVDPDIV
jgi:flagellar motor switch protein FliG